MEYIPWVITILAVLFAIGRCSRGKDYVSNEQIMRSIKALQDSGQTPEREAMVDGLVATIYKRAMSDG